ncbi:protein RGF1 INDUCIBLE TRANSCRIPTION FACTOR 1-like [Wolffia australiana]
MRPPQWLSPLLRSKFFESCGEHRSKINMYCLECRKPMCPYCLSYKYNLHKDHRFFQIRRHLYEDTVRLCDLNQYLDCSEIQPFTVNGAKVLRLNRRKHGTSFPSRSRASSCRICLNVIPEPKRYCSIACKVAAMENENDRQEQILSSFFPEEPNKENLPSSSLMGVSSSAFSTSDPDPATPLSLHVSSSERRRRKRKGIPKRAKLL